jgi:altered-inheritance-of-mitochondria protein 13
MGSALSTVAADSPVSFSQDLVDQLADNAADTEPSSVRQHNIDAHIRARIQAELKQLRAEEQSVRNQIHAALEKENLDRERAMAGDPDSVKTSAALLADLDQVRAKVDRFHARRDLTEYPALREDSEALVACYKSVHCLLYSRPRLTVLSRNNATSPLDCWQQVDKFKASVAQVEQVRLHPE